MCACIYIYTCIYIYMYVYIYIYIEYMHLKSMHVMHVMWALSKQDAGIFLQMSWLTCLEIRLYNPGGQ